MTYVVTSGGLLATGPGGHKQFLEFGDPVPEECTGEELERYIALGAVKDAADESLQTVDLSALDDDQLIDFMVESNAKVVLEAVGDDAIFAQRAYDAEELRGDLARSGVLKALAKIAKPE